MGMTSTGSRLTVTLTDRCVKSHKHGRGEAIRLTWGADLEHLERVCGAVIAYQAAFLRAPIYNGAGSAVNPGHML